MNKHLLAELVDESDVVIHLAAAVGVRLIVESPVRTSRRTFTARNSFSTRLRRRRSSFSRVDVGSLWQKRQSAVPRRCGPRPGTDHARRRWSYAASKALDEFLALSYWKERKQPVKIARFFNTVGPRQTGRYGMVLPNFVRQALAGEPDYGVWHRQAISMLLRRS